MLLIWLFKCDLKATKNERVYTSSFCWIFWIALHFSITNLACGWKDHRVSSTAVAFHVPLLGWMDGVCNLVSWTLFSNHLLRQICKMLFIFFYYCCYYLFYLKITSTKVELSLTSSVLYQRNYQWVWMSWTAVREVLGSACIHHWIASLRALVKSIWE